MQPKMTDCDNYHAHLASIGLGVQSTAMALMIVNGDLPPVSGMVFADTGWEREGTYENLQRLQPLIEGTDIPFHVVSNGDIRQANVDPSIERTELPYFMNASRFETVSGKRELLIKDVKKAWHKEKRALTQLLESNTQASFFDELPELEKLLADALVDFDAKVERGEIRDGYVEMDTTQIGRQCTYKYKIRPTQRLGRAKYGAHFKTPVGMWLGISTDEWSRMSTSGEKAFVLFYPLIDYGYSRSDCEAYLIDHDYEVPVRSSCVGCPYHSNALWREMSDAEIEDAADFEESANTMIENSEKLQKYPYFANGVRLHGSMEPIRTRPFDVKGEDDLLERDGVCGEAGCFL